MSKDTVGRFAPSPTGAQHLGNARTYLLAWMLCRRQPRNRMLLRIEDLETPRVKSWAIDQIYEDLNWLGLTWDNADGCDSNQPATVIQSARIATYRKYLDILLERELAYPCICTRSDIAAASAPHETTIDGSIYPGTCSEYQARDCERLRAEGERFSIRFRTTDASLTYHDGFLQDQTANVRRQLGDFVIWRNEDQPAYQLAVVVDDHEMQVNQVVRGADLVFSTFRQILLYRALGWTPPDYIHVPLVVGLDGKRLAKRHGDTKLSQLRSLGIMPDQVVGYLAWKSGLIPAPIRTWPKDLLTIDPLALLPHESMPFDLETELSQISSIR